MAGEVQSKYQTGSSNKKPILIKKSNYDSAPNYEDFSQDSSTKAKSGFQKGHRVRHPVFGVGIIFKIEGSGEDQQVSILFDNDVLKKFVLKFAWLEKA
jgi:DNA helicase-2/ATP-dependent DNA helicase PcrA